MLAAEESSLFDLSPELVGRIATNLEIFGSDLSNLVVALGCSARQNNNSARDNNQKTFLDAVRAAVLTSESYLDELFTYMPKNAQPIYAEIRRELNTKHEAIGRKVRGWMNANKNWEDRVVEAMLCDSWSVESSGLSRRVSVSGEVASSLILEDRGRFQHDYRYFLSRETKHAALLGELGNHLVSVDGDQYCGSTEMKNLFASKGNEDNVQLYFFRVNDLFFNHPSIVISLGLVEVLRTMVNKGIIQASTTQCSGGPILWNTYIISPNTSCLEYMLSLPNVDCSQIGPRGHCLLHYIMYYVIDTNTLPLGKNAILAIANHPTTDVNALDGEEGMTALHMCIQKCEYRDYPDGDILLKKIEALLEGGADPMIPNRENVTSIQLFRSSRNAHSSLRTGWGGGGDIRESHYDQIESALQNSISNH